MKSRQSWADLFAFEVTRTNDTPLFRQLYLQLRSAILSRRLRPGTKLPSTRELASQLGVSRSAVVAAYEQRFSKLDSAARVGISKMARTQRTEGTCTQFAPEFHRPSVYKRSSLN
jgi:GntR family transcriptional regulator/MocR family aminotransferase